MVDPVDGVRYRDPRDPNQMAFDFELHPYPASRLLGPDVSQWCGRRGVITCRPAARRAVAASRVWARPVRRAGAR
jgi:hypothetical protein